MAQDLPKTSAWWVLEDPSSQARREAPIPGDTLELACEKLGLVLRFREGDRSVLMQTVDKTTLGSLNMFQKLLADASDSVAYGINATVERPSMWTRGSGPRVRIKSDDRIHLDPKSLEPDVESRPCT